ncbi:MAG: IS630 family transposase [Deltaproteobacteria bacterium]|jgi:transposase|nr:IS630 family transposase [Deltaproteobacteria bacterium]
MITVSINKEQRLELEQFRALASSKNSEKALIVLLSSEGKSVSQIADTLKRNPHTVRDWLKRYNADGLKGLSRKYSPGRPDEKRAKLKDHIREILLDSPIDHGYKDHVWSVPLIVYDAASKLNLSVSGDTVTRALNDMGYSYKRPTKTVPARAPTKKEKAERIQSMIEEIKGILSKGETEIYALDESHFSTEPYLVRGWFKKRWPPQNKDKLQKRKSHILWMLKLNDTTILLEAIKAV